jgi:hypothetical protein
MVELLDETPCVLQTETVKVPLLATTGCRNQMFGIHLFVFWQAASTKTGHNLAKRLFFYYFDAEILGCRYSFPAIIVGWTKQIYIFDKLFDTWKDSTRHKTEWTTGVLDAKHQIKCCVSWIENRIWNI